MEPDTTDIKDWLIADRAALVVLAKLIFMSRPDLRDQFAEELDKAVVHAYVSKLPQLCLVLTSIRDSLPPPATPDASPAPPPA